MVVNSITNPQEGTFKLKVGSTETTWQQIEYRSYENSIRTVVRLETTKEEFKGDQFIANVANNLGIDTSIIEINELRVGSVIVDYSMYPSTEDLNSLRDK